MARETLEALHRFKDRSPVDTGDGRRLPSIQRAFPESSLFNRIVAENGAVLFDPSKKEGAIAPPPPPQLVEALQRRRSRPTCRPFDRGDREPAGQGRAGRDQGVGLEVQIIQQGGRHGVAARRQQASGLAEALRELGMSSRNVVGVGDAENDHAFLRAAAAAPR